MNTQAPSKERKHPYHQRINCYGFVNRVTLADASKIRNFTKYGPQPGETSGCFDIINNLLRVMLVTRALRYPKQDMDQDKIDAIGDMISSALTPFRAMADGFIPCSFVDAPPKGYRRVRLYLSLQDFHWVRPEGKYYVGKSADGPVERTLQADSEDENIRRIMAPRHKFIRSIAFYAPPKKRFLNAWRAPLHPTSHDWLVLATRKLQESCPDVADALGKWAKRRGLDMSKQVKPRWFGAYPMVSMDTAWRHFERYTGLRLIGASVPTPVRPEIVARVLRGPPYGVPCSCPTPAPRG